MDHASFVPAAAWVLPFAALLLGIAVLPLAAPHFWESNLRKVAVSLGLGLPVLGLYAIHHPPALLHSATDYVSFMILLGSLYVISGGVMMEGNLRATPGVNCAFLALGALLASFVGTTGASMLLIRPLLSTNSERKHVTHTVVFFIFLVSNIGGCLTPLGDPPLFLGYLQGVPFVWTFRLAPAWLLTSTLVLLVYFIWDQHAYQQESMRARRKDRRAVRALRVTGKENLVALAGIVLAAAFLPAPWREAAMVALAVGSFLRTDPELRQANQFSFHPILEVAAVFAGIFLTMIPALDILRAKGSALGVTQPWQYFWATGALSSFLDNAPTYLTFLALAQGQGLPAEVVGVSHRVLTAISLGAVFMGANTYIGNGPNFMVRAIAESRGVKMPSFGGYMAYSVGVLIPIFGIVTLVFFAFD
jgi:Na+/H+ antiporter NhaD/arsenite permease-like protein